MKVKSLRFRLGGYSLTEKTDREVPAGNGGVAHV